jgi:5-methyltetrahydropteroyltriglutamate--homocysteine methyltransferase
MVDRSQAARGALPASRPRARVTNVILAPDCGMKYLAREVAFGKLKSMVAGAQIVRAELTGVRS